MVIYWVFGSSKEIKAFVCGMLLASAIITRTGHIEDRAPKQTRTQTRSQQLPYPCQTWKRVSQECLEADSCKRVRSTQGPQRESCHHSMNVYANESSAEIGLLICHCLIFAVLLLFMLLLYHRTQALVDFSGSYAQCLGGQADAIVTIIQAEDAVKVNLLKLHTCWSVRGAFLFSSTAQLTSHVRRSVSVVASAILRFALILQL